MATEAPNDSPRSPESPRRLRAVGPAKLADVAARAGVSIKTVSRVVNGDPRVAPDTEQRVRQLIEELGYRPNLAARSLRSGGDNAIGLIVDSVADPFFAAVVGAVEDELEGHGYAVLVASSKRHADRERQLISRLVQRAVAGCILVPTHISQVPAELQGVPLVLLDRRPEGFEADAVVVEDFEASRSAVRHLIDHGHRRIAFVGDLPVLSITVRDRLEGYRAALHEAGIAYTPGLVNADLPTIQSAHERTKTLLAGSERPTAIFAAGTRQAVGVLSAMTEAERKRIAVVSFGDMPLAEALEPGLTVVQHDPTALAREAVQLLLRRINEPDAPIEVRQLPLGLSIRGSGELPPHE